MTVLAGFADALAAPEAIFSLHAAGHRVRALVRAGTRPLAARVLADGPPVEIPAPEADAAGAVAALRAAVAADPALAVLLPLDDPSLWLADAAFGDGTGPRLACATGPQAALALDKRRQIAAAATAGFAVPPTEVLEDAADAARLSLFPCIVKPAMAVRVAGGRLAKGGAVYLESAAARDRASLPAGLFPALAQPLIAGRGEGLFGFATARGLSALSAHARLRMMNPHGSGASACQTIPVDPARRAAAERMLDAAGWRGPFMIELLAGPDGQAWFMELNGRLWGSTALARRAGLEYPAWAVAQALEPGFVPPAPPPFRPLTVRHLGRELMHLAFVLRGPKTAFHRAGWPGFGPALAAVLRPGPAAGFYNHDPAHPFYVLRDAAETVRAGLRKGLG